MTYYARVQNGTVQEVREFDSVEGRFHESLTWVECPASVEEGHQYDSAAGGFSEPTTATVSLSTAQTDEIDRIKRRAFAVLSETDWYVVRKQETGKAIPDAVIDHRAKVRSLSDHFQNEVRALTSVSEVQNYTFSYPDPPTSCFTAPA